VSLLAADTLLLLILPSRASLLVMHKALGKVIVAVFPDDRDSGIEASSMDPMKKLAKSFWRWQSEQMLPKVSQCQNPGVEM
jgi:hypothetical protein